MDIANKNFYVDYSENTTLHSTSHFHAGYEICFFEMGRRSYAIGQNYHEIVPNTIILIEPYVQHSTKGSSNSSRCVVYFTHDFLKHFFSASVIEEMLKSFKREVVFFEQNDTNVYKLVAKLRTAYAQNDIQFAAVLLAEILFSVSRTNSVPKHTNEKRSTPSYVIPLAISYIGQNINAIPNVQAVADHLNISSSYLSALFKDQIGTPIKQYLIKIRINHAVKQLISTDKSITEIAMECGFNSNTHFCNTFKKHIGTNPADYRKRNHD